MAFDRPSGGVCGDKITFLDAANSLNSGVRSTVEKEVCSCSKTSKHAPLRVSSLAPLLGPVFTQLPLEVLISRWAFGTVVKSPH